MLTKNQSSNVFSRCSAIVEINMDIRYDDAKQLLER